MSIRSYDSQENIRFSRKPLSTKLDFSLPYNYTNPFSTLQPVSEYGCKPKPAQLREKGWEVSEGRGGGMTRHLSANLPPPLSSESRPEGHPLYGYREYYTAVGRTKDLSFYIKKITLTAVSRSRSKNPLQKASCQHPRCKRKKSKSSPPLPPDMPVDKPPPQEYNNTVMLNK